MIIMVHKQSIETRSLSTYELSNKRTYPLEHSTAADSYCTFLDQPFLDMELHPQLPL